jgi:carbon-monoxide dehydrogenase small subunit
MNKVSLTVNGKKHIADVEPRQLLVHFLRDELRLTGTHIGCDTSSCGSCTVLIDNKTIKSCTFLTVQAEGCEIRTIEGMAAADGSLHPLQKALHEYHGLQCGFCTPGIIMTASELLNRNKKPDEQEIRHALEGNFCRCTGYHNIVKAIHHATTAI